MGTRGVTTALVLGGAGCVYEDIEAALKLFTPDAIAAVNAIGIEWPGRLDYWATLHPGEKKQWPGIVEAMRLRLMAGHNRPQTWCYKPFDGVDRHTSDWGGSSGLLAVKILIEEGFTHIVGAGVPMTMNLAHFNDHKPWLAANSYQRGWIRHRAEIEACFRSLSGWTRKEFGSPTANWLAGS